MSLVALDGTPLVRFGNPNRQGLPILPGLTSFLIDAAKEAVFMVGQIFTEDGASHTIDTTGSSSLGWRVVGSTFANGSTTVKVGLAALDTTTGIPGRPVTVSDVVTFDVSKSLTGGGGGITANAWNEHVPDTGSKTIANGDKVAFCVQMTALGGADTVNVGCPSSATTGSAWPHVSAFQGGSYANVNGLPDAVITFSDGVRGYFIGGYVAATTATTQTWNSGSGTKEYGNLFQFPVPVRIYGICGAAAVGGDTDFILYSDPLGTPAAQKTTSIDKDTMGVATTLPVDVLFSSAYDLPANTPIGAILKPTTTTNISCAYLSVNTAAHMKAWPLGTNGYAVNRASGAFAAQNSSKDRFALGLLLGAFDSGGYPASRVLLGM